MKFGSVQFFKRVIVFGYLLLILVPLLAAVVLGWLYTQEKQRADALQEATLAELTQILQNAQAEPGAESLDLEDLDALLDLQEPESSFPYQVLYPHLYAQRPLLQTAEDNVCYLTFDDGPSSVTPQVLAILDEYNIKATFFVTGESCEKYPDELRAIAAAGHSIGIHTYSHDYETIYSSVEAYLSDFEKIYSLILDTTGIAPEIFRFPGGSVNAYNQTVYTQLVAELSRRGFVYYDWNSSAEDAVQGGLSSERIADNVLQSAVGQDRLVVLLHNWDDNASTAAALPSIIEGLERQGFQFQSLNNTVVPIVFYWDAVM